MLGAHMEAEIREQPSVLEANARSYYSLAQDAVGDFRPEIAVLAARGSSDNAALYARYLIEIHLGIPAVLASPSVWTRYSGHIRFPKCLAIGISQSGAAPDVGEVLSALRKDGHRTLAITNTPGSALTEIAEHSLMLEAGQERSVAATKTYTASLLALYQVVRALGANAPDLSDLSDVPSLPDPAGTLPTDAWIEAARRAAEDSAGVLLRSAPLFALARGYGFSTANETALKLMECAQLACKSFSTADFQHGPKALAGHGTAAIVFGEPADWLEEQGCSVVMAPVPGGEVRSSKVEGRGSGDEGMPEAGARSSDAGLEVPDPLRPIWDVVFGQWLALTASRARGLNADDPQFLKKVTRTL